MPSVLIDRKTKKIISIVEGQKLSSTEEYEVYQSESSDPTKIFNELESLNILGETGGLEKLTDLITNNFAETKGAAKLIAEQGDLVAGLKKLQKLATLSDYTDYNKGGRVGMWGGGILSKFLNQFGRQAPGMKQFHPQGINPTLKHDAEQIKNIIRNPKTDLERRVETPKDHPTVRDVEDFVQNNKNYTEWEKKAMFHLIRKEKLRVEVADARGIDPADVPDDVLEFMLKNDPTAGDFSKGGRVGIFAGGKTAKILPFKPRKKKAMGGQIGVGSLFRNKKWQ